MTEEEIRPIAENYVEEYCHCSDGEYTDGSLVCAGIGTALIVSRQLEKRIAELEKENAKLKERLAIINLNGNIVLRELTEAKDLLKQWLQTSKASGCDNINIVTDTEQFLNSEVEK